MSLHSINIKNIDFFEFIFIFLKKRTKERKENFSHVDNNWASPWFAGDGFFLKQWGLPAFLLANQRRVYPLFIRDDKIQRKTKKNRLRKDPVQKGKYSFSIYSEIPRTGNWLCYKHSLVMLSSTEGNKWRGGRSSV